jgi:hypothetical protein
MPAKGKPLSNADWQRGPVVHKKSFLFIESTVECAFIMRMENARNMRGSGGGGLSTWRLRRRGTTRPPTEGLDIPLRKSIQVQNGQKRAWWHQPGFRAEAYLTKESVLVQSEKAINEAVSAQPTHLAKNPASPFTPRVLQDSRR